MVDRISGPLQMGSQGGSVSVLQNSLNQAIPSAPRLKADGIFGVRTHGRVVSFQTGAGLTADGVVGPRTAGALKLEYVAAPIVPRPAPLPVPNGGQSGGAGGALTAGAAVGAAVAGAAGSVGGSLSPVGPDPSVLGQVAEAIIDGAGRIGSAITQAARNHPLIPDFVADSIQTVVSREVNGLARILRTTVKIARTANDMVGALSAAVRSGFSQIINNVLSVLSNIPGVGAIEAALRRVLLRVNDVVAKITDFCLGRAGDAAAVIQWVRQTLFGLAAELGEALS